MQFSRLPSTILLALFAARAEAATALPEAAVLLMEGPEYRHAHWGLLAVDLDSGETIHELDPDRLFVPASVTKLFSAVAAWTTLGPDYVFETRVCRRGSIDESGVLQGDLVLVASGDPTMGGRATAGGRLAFTDTDHIYATWSASAGLTLQDPLAGLRDLARQIARSGIVRVTGDVLIDDRLFEHSTGSGSGPQRVTPIMINDNVVDFTITPTKPGEPATVEWRPKDASITVDARVTTSPEKQTNQVKVSTAGPGRFVVRGTISAGSASLVRNHETDDPASFARSLFIQALGEAGVEVAASSLERNPAGRLPDPGAEPLPAVARFTSPPLAEHVRLILKVSHNLHASELPLLLAVKAGKRTLTEGLRLQGEALRRLGVDTGSLAFGGGAGGSRADHVTPRAVVQLLRAMYSRPDFERFKEALPVLGVDGTLATVVATNSPARGRVWAKTGTLAWEDDMNGRLVLTSKAMAGYLTTAGNRRLAFAVFVNGTFVSSEVGGSREGRALGRLCEILSGAKD